ncbi:MAG: VWA domain-containing protein, partial [Candidatus Omnitrophota bacterium]
AKSKIIILLTDGRNNAGDISPQTAAEMARSLGVKVYTVGVGTKGLVQYPFTDSLGIKRYKNIRIDLDEETLKMIAQKTNGKYFRATDTESLKNVYKEINNLEKTKIKGKKFSEYDELFGKFLMWGLIILFFEVTLENTFLRKIP